MTMRTHLQAHLQKLYRYALTLTRQDDAARDLVQDTCVRALGAANVPTDDTAFRVWLFRIMRNAHIDRWRAERPGRVDWEEVDRHHVLNPWESENANIDRIQVALGFERLSYDHREILGLVDILSFSYAESAAILGVPVGTVMSRLSRARQALIEHCSTESVVSFNRKRSR